MNEMLEISEEGGLYSTLLPPFNQEAWPKIVPSVGFVWISNPSMNLTGEMDPIVGRLLFGSMDVDVQCSIHRIEFDVSISAVEFLRIVEAKFRHGIDFIHSKKQQPHGFRLSSIPRSNWPGVMINNQIEFVFHRPAGGEPSLVTSCEKDTLISIVERFTHVG